jgi:hypothetical protein
MIDVENIRTPAESLEGGCSLENYLEKGLLDRVRCLG